MQICNEFLEIDLLPPFNPPFPPLEKVEPKPSNLKITYEKNIEACFGCATPVPLDLFQKVDKYRVLAPPFSKGG